MVEIFMPSTHKVNGKTVIVAVPALVEDTGSPLAILNGMRKALEWLDTKSLLYYPKPQGMQAVQAIDMARDAVRISNMHDVTVFSHCQSVFGNDGLKDAPDGTRYPRDPRDALNSACTPRPTHIGFEHAISYAADPFDTAGATFVPSPASVSALARPPGRPAKYDLSPFLHDTPLSVTFGPPLTYSECMSLRTAVYRFNARHTRTLTVEIDMNDKKAIVSG